MLLKSIFVDLFFTLHLLMAQFLDESEWTFQVLYDFGVESYTEQQWFECTAYMRRALEDYHSFRTKLLKCRHECSSDLSQKFTRKFKQDIDNVVNERLDIRDDDLLLLFGHYQMVDFDIRQSGCIRACDKRAFVGRPIKERTSFYVNVFEKRLPYSYLQLCYYKGNNVESAVQAAYTYYVMNPNDKMILAALKFYNNQPSFDKKMLVDLEEANYQKKHREAVAAYDAGDYHLAIDKFMETLDYFYSALYECRLMCDIDADIVTDGKWDHTHLYASDVSAIKTDIHASLLTCRHSCLFRLSRVSERKVPDYLPAMYNYLQYAHHKVNQPNIACKMTADYLLFLPDDQLMLDNQNYYQSLFNAIDDFDTKFVCEPSKQATDYASILNLEAQLLIIYNHFVEVDEDGMYSHGNEDASDPTDFNNIQQLSLNIFARPDDAIDDSLPDETQEAFIRVVTKDSRRKIEF